MSEEHIRSLFPIVPDHYLKQVDKNNWLLGSDVLISRQNRTSRTNPYWESDEKGFFYTIGPAPSPLPRAYAMVEDISVRPRKGPDFPHDDMKLVLHSNYHQAVWKVGKAKIRLKRYASPNITREHATLEYVQSKEDLCFRTPEILYHGDFSFGYVIVIKEDWGTPLSEIWQTLGPGVQRQYVEKVANAYKQMAEWQCNRICGSDGNQSPIAPLSLNPEDNVDESDHSHKKLYAACLKMGMKPSTFIFSHYFPTVRAILVKSPEEDIMIRCWSEAAFVPKECIRTDICSSKFWSHYTADSEYGWRSLLQESLKEKGFPLALEGFGKYWHHEIQWPPKPSRKS
ncbi:hypothetical protein AK830_g12426 [Neonectria ditissima]|uniref:Aminoglycoside phosphotransferase domain-containing protein n=1 Tax=Neonectria ditissima TaxID=78410 RepID=A0A0P7AZ39_9HYPO|nr:hypothetical protein AK830_g12426 [Neonectria ditissima]